jgi:hypothetical protein
MAVVEVNLRYKYWFGVEYDKDDYYCAVFNNVLQAYNARASFTLHHHLLKTHSPQSPFVYSYRPFTLDSFLSYRGYKVHTFDIDTYCMLITESRMIASLLFTIPLY